MSTAGYSGTPLAKKLGIEDDHAVLLVNSPENFLSTLGRLPDGVSINHSLVQQPSPDVIVVFAGDRTTLLGEFPSLAAALKPNGGLWIAWPKKSSGVPTDLDFNQVQAVGLSNGMVDNKVCAIDTTWSGLRFVYRIKDRRK